MHVFFCFVRVSFCYFSLPLGVGGWLAAVCDCGTPWTFLLTILRPPICLLMISPHCILRYHITLSKINLLT